MKNLVRGGSIVLLSCMLVALIYAQGTPDGGLIIANNSQDNLTTEDSFNSEILDTEVIETVTTDDDADKKLVKTTGSARAAGAGASKGMFFATAYCFSGRTAMGHKVRRGLIAADPRVLRLGSKVYVSAGQWSGTYLVSDTGGAIKGKKIDIWVPGCGEARKFGRRSVQVFAAQ
jgi:3D (Asp-Asp-Asp) domain-containing protein